MHDHRAVSARVTILHRIGTRIAAALTLLWGKR
jgi:hypothetical protein